MSAPDDSRTPDPAPLSTLPPVATAEVAVSANEASAGLAPVPKRGPGLLILAIVSIIALSLLALFVAVYLLLALGGDAVALGGVMALVPLTIVIIGVRLVDRWEPEPRLAVVLAFLWGAAVAVIIALLVGASVDAYVAARGGPGEAYDFLTSVIQAPVVEEGGKGLGILLIFLFARRYFDGPVDGIVYGAWIAAGFAFTENILYFGSQLLDSGGLDGAVAEIFLIRGLMSPFAHVMFTACTGFAIGLAARRFGALGGIIAFVVGLIPAMLLHALWNGALFFVYDFYGYYAIVQFPLFVIAVLLVLYLRRREVALTLERLTEYADAGWFSHDELGAIATPRGRRTAMAWARSRGIGRLMKQYIRDATSLAFARQRIVSGRDRIGSQADEAVLLANVAKARAALTAGTPATPTAPAL